MSRPNKLWFRKSNKRWYVWFDGKQVNLGPDKQSAQQQFHELMAQPKECRTAPILATISLVEVVDHFLDWVKRHRAPDTYGWYQYRLQRLCLKYPQMMAATMRPYHVEQWVSEYDLSQTSCRNYLRSVKRCYKWAKQQGYIKENPISDLEVPTAESRDVSFSQDEFEHLLSYVRNKSLRDLLVVTWETGCRPQESLRVEARHVDLKNQRWIFHRSESKNRKISRVVYLSDAAVEIVHKLTLCYPQGKLFRNSQGNPWTTEAVNCALQAVRIRMGKEAMRLQGIKIEKSAIAELIPTLKPSIKRGGHEVPKTAAELRCEAKRKLTYKIAAELAPRYSLYALRHSFATNALRKGIDSMTVAILLGHEDPSTLARVYQHLNQNPEHLLSEIRKAAS